MNVPDGEDEWTLEANRVLSSCLDEHGCARKPDTYWGMLVCERCNLLGNHSGERVLSKGLGYMSRGVFFWVPFWASCFKLHESLGVALRFGLLGLLGAPEMPSESMIGEAIIGQFRS